jgi:hypothetical protein
MSNLSEDSPKNVVLKVKPLKEVSDVADVESSRYIPFKVPKTQEEMLATGKSIGIE